MGTFPRCPEPPQAESPTAGGAWLLFTAGRLSRGPSGLRARFVGA